MSASAGRAKAQSANAGQDVPSFVVGDVASLPFPDASFDVVVSTLSMHHWTDPAIGLAEVARVLRPDGRALIWDLRAGTAPHPFAPRHTHAARIEELHASGLRPLAMEPWRWPWRFSLVQRMELARERGLTRAGE